MRELRIGVLGTGGIARTHVKALQKLPGVRVVALCNHHVEKAEALNHECGLEAQAFADFDRMLRDVAMDALYICLPPGAHAGQAEAAAARGLHLMLEKPIALTLERGRSIAQAVRQAGVQCQIGHHLRHADPVRRLKAMIDDGTAGRPLMMQGRWFCNALHPAWWRDPEMGGGQLIEQAIHVYDLARHFLGEARTVVGFAGRLAHERYPDYRVDDASAATIRFDNGAIASLCASNSAVPGEWATLATILCEKLTVELRAPASAVFIHHGGLPAEALKDHPPIQREQVENATNCYDALNRNFIAALRGEEPMGSGIDDGLRGLELVCAVARSSAEGGTPQWVGD